MPQYELMYILSSAVPDNEESVLTDSVTEFISSVGGEILNVEKLGKKKLAYPIKKTRNGFYVLVNFKVAPDQLAEVDHKVRVTGNIIRHLIINKENDLIRQAKDREEQRTMRKTRAVTATAKKAAPDIKLEIKLDLDKQIEKALEEEIK